MSSELEARLRRTLARLGRPGADAEERALRLALAALPAAEPRRDRRLRALVLAAAALLCLLTVSAGALAAAGALHVSLGGERRPAAAAVSRPRLLVPPRARGIAAVVGGELWLSTRSGLRIEGLPVESAALSPRARYVAAGIGDSLIAMAPDGTRAWSHRTAGRVVAIAWAPTGLRIAYVVRTAAGFQLRLVEGDGDHDQLVDPAVRPVPPSWRADSLAVAYAGAGGQAAVYDLAHRSHGAAPALRGVTSLAFAPRGKALAVAAGERVQVGRRVERQPSAVAALAWVGDRLAVGLAGGLVRVAGETLADGGRIEALDAGGGRLVAAAAGRVLALPGGRILLEAPPGAAIRGLGVR